MRTPVPLMLAHRLAALLLVLSAGAQAQAIGALQGTSHRSPLADTRVDDIAGIVTAVEARGFWIQDQGDGNALTSDAIFVFRGAGLSRPKVGDAVRVTGQLQEFRPGGQEGANNLTTTQINAGNDFAAFASWTRVSSGNMLPPAIVVDAGLFPPVVIAPPTGPVDAAGRLLQPSAYAIDFHESLEGMRVHIPSAVAVGPRNRFGEVPVIASAQVGMSGVIGAPRGGVVVGPGRFNGHRIQLDSRLFATPDVHSGAQLRDVVGVLDYSFGNYKLHLTQAVTVASNALIRESTTIGPGRIGVASINVENLGGTATESRISALAAQIGSTLGAPHLVALQEVQDNSGATNDGTVASDITLGRLTKALNMLSGRQYRFVVVDPQNLADGGQPGGNIRQAFLYDATRIRFSGRIGGARDAIRATAGPDGSVRFNLAAGRIEPTHAAFQDSRKPLAAVFTVDGHSIVIVNVHFNSKGGDQPLFGTNQPPAQSSAAQRLAQAKVVQRFVASVLAIDHDANLIVLGDLNDFQFADTLTPLHAAGLTNLTTTLPEGERYTYNYEGNLQALDHLFASPNLVAKGALVYDIVHANAEFSDQLSDHDPIVLSFTLAPVP